MTSIEVGVVIAFDPELFLAALNWQPNLPVPNIPVHGSSFDSVQQRLRAYVDTWVDSGLRPDGSEAPLDRNWRRIETTALEPSGTGNAAIWLMNSIGWFCDNHRIKEFFPVGAQHQALQLVETLDDKSDDIDRSIASYLLGPVLLSELRYGICKCRRCGDYFYLDKVSRSRVYTNGCFCSIKCNRRTSATQRMRETREQFKRTVEQKAAQILTRHKDWSLDSHSLKKMRDELDTFVKNHPALHTVRRRNYKKHSFVEKNWITRHWSAIEKQARLIRDGKKQKA